MEDVESQLESFKSRQQGTEITGGKNYIQLEEMEEKLKGLLETQESWEVASRKEIGKGSGTFIYSSVTF